MSKKDEKLELVTIALGQAESLVARDAEIIRLRNLLREWAGDRVKRPDLKARTMAAIADTKDL